MNTSPSTPDFKELFAFFPRNGDSVFNVNEPAMTKLEEMLGK